MAVQQLIRGVWMSQKKLKRWSHRFELAPEDDRQVKLHEHLQRLGELEISSDWIRETLLAALPAKAANQSIIAKARQPNWMSNSLIGIEDRMSKKPRNDETIYEDIDT